VVLEKKLRRVLVGSHQFSVSNFILNRIPLYRPKVGVGVEKGFSLLSSHVSFLLGWVSLLSGGWPINAQKISPYGEAHLGE
jgi:hypothetical protein